MLIYNIFIYIAALFNLTKTQRCQKCLANQFPLKLTQILHVS